MKLQIFELPINALQICTLVKEKWILLARYIPLDQYMRFIQKINMQKKELNSILENVCIVEFDLLFALKRNIFLKCCKFYISSFLLWCACYTFYLINFLWLCVASVCLFWGYAVGVAESKCIIDAVNSSSLTTYITR